MPNAQSFTATTRLNSDDRALILLALGALYDTIHIDHDTYRLRHRIINLYDKVALPFVRNHSTPHDPTLYRANLRVTLPYIPFN